MRGVSFAVVMALGLASGRPVVAQDSVGARSAALASLFKEMGEDRLKSDPEFASAQGDRRYNDQVKDLSARAANEELARDREFLMRLVVIDTTGMSERDRQLADLLQQELFEAEEAAKFKEWELPITPFRSVPAEMVAGVTKFPFATVKDYDDYLARLKKYAGELRQASSNMLAGIDDGRVEPVDVIEKALKQAEDVAGQKTEESVFAQPLKRFPTTVGAGARKRIAEEMLEAIEDEVLPAYGRFASFLKATEIPAAEKMGGAWAAKEGVAYADFCARRAVTVGKIAGLRGK